MSEESDIVTDQDIEVLLNRPIDAKVDVIKKIGQYYSAGDFSDGKQNIAEKILLALMHQSDLDVKITISHSVNKTPNVSNKIVMELAEDENKVSLPVLEFSPVLTDDNLITIINKTDDVEKHKVISKRETVNHNVSEALVDKGNEEVVRALLLNEGSSVTDHICEKIINMFPDKQQIISSLKKKAKIPGNLIRSIKEDIKSNNVYKHNLEREYIEFEERVSKANIREDIAPIYALCLGNVKLFELCLSKKVGVPVVNVRKLVNDEGKRGFCSIYKKAKLNGSLLEATDVLLYVLKDLRKQIKGYGLYLTAEDSSQITRSLNMYAKEVGGVKNLEYIISIIRSNVK